MATISKTQLEERLDQEFSSLLKDSRLEGFSIDPNIKITFEGFLADKMLIIAAIRVGIPYSLFELIQLYTPFTEGDWADFLGISTKSLQRYKASETHSFKPIYSEKIIEMVEVTKVGWDVFGSIEKLKLWLNTPNYSLGKLKPIDLLKDSYGKELVLNELVRIDHGIFV